MPALKIEQPRSQLLTRHRCRISACGLLIWGMRHDYHRTKGNGNHVRRFRRAQQSEPKQAHNERDVCVHTGMIQMCACFQAGLRLHLVTIRVPSFYHESCRDSHPSAPGIFSQPWGLGAEHMFSALSTCTRSAVPSIITGSVFPTIVLLSNVGAIFSHFFPPFPLAAFAGAASFLLVCSALAAP